MSMSWSSRIKEMVGDSPIKVGNVVAGKYKVERILGAGGMGVVASARHEALGQLFAVKCLHPQVMTTEIVARFLREAQAAAAIHSEHVCRVFDCGTLDSGVPYLIMEHLAGNDLGTELRTRGPLPQAEAVDIVLEAIEGVAEAHAVGIVHRDLKPSNLFLAERGGRARLVKVLDFGISKVESADEASITQTSSMLGSPRYIAPEQARNAKDADARADIWSIGVILYEALTADSPFAGATFAETIARVLTHPPPPLLEKRPGSPPALAAVLDRCLTRDRTKRFQNVAELALALAPFGSGRCRSVVDRVTQLLVEGQLAPRQGGSGAAVEVVSPDLIRLTDADEVGAGGAPGGGQQTETLPLTGSLARRLQLEEPPQEPAPRRSARTRWVLVAIGGAAVLAGAGGGLAWLALGNGDRRMGDGVVPDAAGAGALSAGVHVANDGPESRSEPSHTPSAVSQEAVVEAGATGTASAATAGLASGRPSAPQSGKAVPPTASARRSTTRKPEDILSTSD